MAAGSAPLMTPQQPGSEDRSGRRKGGGVWASLSLPAVGPGECKHPSATVSLPLPPYSVLKATEMSSQFRRGNGLWRIIKQQKIDKKFYLGKPLRGLHNGLTLKHVGLDEPSFVGWRRSHFLHPATPRPMRVPLSYTCFFARQATLQALEDQKASNVPDCTQESISLQLGQMEDLSQPQFLHPQTGTMIMIRTQRAG